MKNLKLKYDINGIYGNSREGKCDRNNFIIKKTKLLRRSYKIGQVVWSYPPLNMWYKIFLFRILGKIFEVSLEISII